MATFLNSLKAYLKRTPMYPPLRAYFQRRRYRQWIERGRAGRPPHLAKQMAVSEYAKRFNLRTLVETGTYLGDMIDAVESHFDRIYTIELGDELFRRARLKFAKNPKVTTLHGDSGQKIRDVLAQIVSPSLFWLDAHYTSGLGVSGRGTSDTPILSELRHIIDHPLARQHVILIDDADEFTGENDYPPLRAVQELATDAGYDSFEVTDNVIRIFCASDSGRLEWLAQT